MMLELNRAEVVEIKDDSVGHRGHWDTRYDLEHYSVPASPGQHQRTDSNELSLCVWVPLEWFVK